jgi:hypothetical protein
MILFLFVLCIMLHESCICHRYEKSEISEVQFSGFNSGHVVEQGFAPENEDELVLLRGYDQRADFRSISDYHVTCPDRISQCLHYTCREILIHLYDLRLLDGSALPKGHPRLDVVTTDCHTHLDELFRKYDHPLSSLEILMDPG